MESHKHIPPCMPPDPTKRKLSKQTNIKKKNQTTKQQNTKPTNLFWRMTRYGMEQNMPLVS